MGAFETFPGRLIRIEGPDRAGKSTQITKAKQYAEENDIPTIFVREPGGTKFGVEIRSLLLHNRDYNFAPVTEYALLTADRSHLIQSVIMPHLEDGFTVISDRGIESSVCYQSAAGGMTKEQVLGVGNLLFPKRYMEPDALALLSISKEVRRQRMHVKRTLDGLDKIELRNVEYFDKVHDGYIDLESLPYAQVIDAEQSPEEVFNMLRPVLFGREHA
jgi:dTMP kinase